MFSWDDQTVEAKPGEPVATALWRAGIRTQTRSIKFHRARGPMCFTGDCPGCMVRVDGVPNQLGCRTPVQEGMEVASQVGMPDAEHDVLSIVDRVFEHFDHERRFVRPRPVRVVYQAIARRLAGFGTAPTGTLDVTEGQRRETGILVAGGGPAGLSAARAAQEAGGQVLHVDEAGFGGSLLHTPGTVDAGSWGQAPGPELATKLQADGIERVDGTVFGVYDDVVAVLAVEDDGLAVHTVDAETLVIAAGATENPALLDGNDRPGVLGARAARILLNRWEVPPGDPIAIVDPGRQGEAFHEEATQAGLTVHRVDEARALDGDPEVTGVRTPDGAIEAEVVVVDTGLTPAPELGRQAGVPYGYEAALGGRVPHHDPDGRTPVPDVLVAGSAAGVHVPEAAIQQGRWAGQRAAGRDPKADPGNLTGIAALTDEERAALERTWRRP